MSIDSLKLFCPAVKRWFSDSFDTATPPQMLGWPHIAKGEHTLICAPTGSGKTLAAFLFCLDDILRSAREHSLPKGVHTLYISPLKALNYDVERNLRAPLDGISQAAKALETPTPKITVAVRTGDTPQKERRALLQKPPALLITTPESLFLLLTSKRARPLLRTVRFVVVDEIHALLGNKRGVNLSLCLERLVEIAQKEPVRVGLSATLKPLDEAARFLGGYFWKTGNLERRAVSIVDASVPKSFDLKVVAPVSDYSALSADSVWPEVHQALAKWIEEHKSTLIFVRMRAQAERLSRAVNELAAKEISAAHHGSLSPLVRRELEGRFQTGELRALISTGTLELGIDVGSIDLVAQLSSPTSVSTGLQRVGRAGHLLSRLSRGRLVPLYREDLVECTVLAKQMLAGLVEPKSIPENPLDVVSQHLISEVAMASRRAGDLFKIFRRAAPFQSLTRAAFDAVLELLAGRYPAHLMRGLGAKLTWERTTDLLSALPGAQRLAVMCGGTIPDQGYFTLKLSDGTRLGELEEEFVYERSIGDIIAFGSNTWRILDIDRERVTVTPAPGEPAVIPFWKGGIFGRDPALSEEIGAFRRQLYASVTRPEETTRWLRETFPIDVRAAENLVRYFEQQRQRDARVGTDQTVVVERFTDDIGDHNLLVHSCFGNRLNAPWALALRHRLREALAIEPQITFDDNGIFIRVPAAEAPPPMNLLELIDADEIEDLVLGELPHTPLYGALFRQNAARFLVLGTHGVAKRTPLWLQRLRAKDLQQATAEFPEFPVRLETFRECLKDLMDLPRLKELLCAIQEKRIEVIKQDSPYPSPVASSLMNRFTAQYMYEYDQPRAERLLNRMQVDRSLLDQIMARPNVAELLLQDAVNALEDAWQGRAARFKARHPEELFQIVFRHVLLNEKKATDYCTKEANALIASLIRDGRLSRFCVGSSTKKCQAAVEKDIDKSAKNLDGADFWLCATEDLPLLAAAYQPVVLKLTPSRTFAAMTLTSEEACQRVIERRLDLYGPVLPSELHKQTGLNADKIKKAFAMLIAEGKLREGLFREGHSNPTYCTPHNLERIRRRSIVLTRRQTEPVDSAVLQQFIIEHQHISPYQCAHESEVFDVLSQLSLRLLPAVVLERDVLPSRLKTYQGMLLDDLITSGEMLWTGGEPQSVRLILREDLPLYAPAAKNLAPPTVVVRRDLAEKGALFLSEIAPTLAPSEVPRSLWQLVWAGLATNDRFACFRQGLAKGFKNAGVRAAVNTLTGKPSTARSKRFGQRLKRQRFTPLAMGRWSLLMLPEGIDEKTKAELFIDLLLRRYGLVLREFVQMEGILPWSALYPWLCQLELSGDLRRGLFVQGLGGAQFAPSASIDRLRAIRQTIGTTHRKKDRQAKSAVDGPNSCAPKSPFSAVLLNACDPAFIAPAIHLTIPVPTPFIRRPSTYVVIERGNVVMVAESLGKRVYFANESQPQDQRRWLSMLPDLLQRGHRFVRVEEVNGEAALKSSLRPFLMDLGFEIDGNALELRRFSSKPTGHTQNTSD